MVQFFCKNCKKEFFLKESVVRKNTKRGVNVGFYCSRSCKSKSISKKTFLKGDKSSKWKGGVTISAGGYRLVYCPEHPNATKKRKYVYEHRLVVENSLGRYLEKWEVVHHVDGNKTNNNIDNLEVLTSSEHARNHQIGNHARVSFFKGKKHRPESIKKMRDAKLGKKRSFNSQPRHQS